MPFNLDSLKVFDNLEILKIIHCDNLDFKENNLFRFPNAFKKIKVTIENCIGIPSKFLLYRSSGNLKDFRVSGLLCFAEVLQSCIESCHGLVRIETTLSKQHIDLFINLLKVCKDLRTVCINDSVYMDSVTIPTSFNINQSNVRIDNDHKDDFLDYDIDSDYTDEDEGEEEGEEEYYEVEDEDEYFLIVIVEVSKYESNQDSKDDKIMTRKKKK
ncbi:hypothetical protein Glove_132g10 [Diversispora epigaea]|uniref:Uncharacterized protein n=1 Tax=Diversispora epigaea TaxID=1348612 RepID=A0A397IXY8_9GLOM|nr:hypothetical protein Glove_132g10 [Diversispora epigaea]